MVNNQEDHIQTTIKNLSQESQDLLNELQSIATKAADIIPRLYASLRKDGLTKKDARNMIQSRMDVSDRTIRRTLPEEAKQEYNRYHNGKLDKMSDIRSRTIVQNQAKLADVTSVSIPPPEQPIIEPEGQEQPDKKRISALEAELTDRNEAYNQLAAKTEMLQDALKKSSFSSASDLPEQQQQPQNRKHEECFMPLPFAEILNKFKLARLIGMAKANGDTAITFKINNEGDLYLP